MNTSAVALPYWPARLRPTILVLVAAVVFTAILMMLDGALPRSPFSAISRDDSFVNLVGLRAISPQSTR